MSQVDLERDPEWYAHDIVCAVADMAERFDREALLAALVIALAPLKIEAVDLKMEIKDAA